MKEVLNQQPQQCIFDELNILKSLSENCVPEHLKNRLNYNYDELSDGTTREVYTDKVTGDSFAGGILPVVAGFISYGIVNTRVGEYKFLSYLGEKGCMGNEFFFNGIQTEYDTFFSILKQQISLSDFENK